MKKYTIIYLVLVALLITVVTACSAQTTWKPYHNNKPDSTTIGTGAYQCWGTTKKQERCKRRVKCDKCYCYQHQYQSK